MANVNANQPPNPPNPPLAWKARSPLNLTPPLHGLPQAFEKLLPKFYPNEKVFVDDHLQSFYLEIEGLRAGEYEDVVCRLFHTPLKAQHHHGTLVFLQTLSQIGIPFKGFLEVSMQPKKLMQLS